MKSKITIQEFEEYKVTTIVTDTVIEHKSVVHMLNQLCDLLLDRDLDWDRMHTDGSMRKLQHVRGEADKMKRLIPFEGVNK